MSQPVRLPESLAGPFAPSAAVFRALPDEMNIPVVPVFTLTIKSIDLTNDITVRDQSQKLRMKIPPNTIAPSKPVTRPAVNSHSTS